MKLMRKLEKQALARAAKEARKQQGKPKKLCVLLTGAQVCKYSSSVCIVLHLVTSSHDALNDWRTWHDVLNIFKWVMDKHIYTEEENSDLCSNYHHITLTLFLVQKCLLIWKWAQIYCMDGGDDSRAKNYLPIFKQSCQSEILQSPINSQFIASMEVNN